MVGQLQAWPPPDQGATSTGAWSVDEGRTGETSESPKFQIVWLFCSQLLAILVVCVEELNQKVNANFAK